MVCDLFLNYFVLSRVRRTFRVCVSFRKNNEHAFFIRVFPLVLHMRKRSEPPEDGAAGSYCRHKHRGMAGHQSPVECSSGGPFGTRVPPQPHETTLPTPFAGQANTFPVTAPNALDGFKTTVLRLPSNVVRDMPHFWFKDL